MITGLRKYRVPLVRDPLAPTPFAAQIRIGGEWQSLGTVMSNSRGRVTLPSNRISEKKTFPIRLINAQDQCTRQNLFLETHNQIDC
jgi:hypothetical protein